jgi:hypothetical protein
MCRSPGSGHSVVATRLAATGLAVLLVTGCSQTMQPTEQVPPSPTANIVGRITLPNGKPVPQSAVITLSPLFTGPGVTSTTAYIEEDGRYFARGFKPGTYRLEITVPNEKGNGDVLNGAYSSRSSSIQVVAKDTTKDGVDQVFDVQLK